MKNIGKISMLLVLSGALVLILGMTKGGNSAFTEDKEEAEGAVLLHVISDPHYLSKRINDEGPAFQRYMILGDGKNLFHMDKILAQYEKVAKAARPKLLLVSGDLTNNGEKESHEDLAAYFEKLEELGIEVLVTPGNHDLNNPHARGFQGETQRKVDTLSPEEFRDLYGAFGFQEALYEDAHSLSYVYEASKDLWVFMVDTNKYHRNEALRYPEPGGILSLGTLTFLREKLKEAEALGVEVLTVSHHNALIHSPLAVEDYVLDNHEEYENILKRHHVRLNLTGHIHIQHIEKSTGSKELHEIAQGALSVYPHTYGVLHHEKSTGFRYETKKLPLAEVMMGSRATDFVPLGSWSRDFFMEKSTSRIIQGLLAEGMKEEEVMKMAKTLGALNVLYFSGETRTIPEALYEEEGLQLILAKENHFTRYYVERILSKEGPEDTFLALPPREN